MRDRIPTRPNRRLITPENGAPYYATVERADEPVEVGTPLNALNLASDSTLLSLGLPADASVNDALAQLRKLTIPSTFQLYMTGAFMRGGM